ncbi:zinc finger protein 92 homolog [Neopsephotus bourkii]|uniref:zinc finger protein 92 homolog n=1 Tax=Neopsephotus bourkii TaxID=309878 RepID=UPI002AA5B557|nr:zinc finger protein 92 homolog [Neopsephotus bourkii]
MGARALSAGTGHLTVKPEIIAKLERGLMPRATSRRRCRAAAPAAGVTHMHPGVPGVLPVPTTQLPAVPEHSGRPQRSVSRMKSRPRCPECNRSFRSRRALGVHARRHLGERPFTCTQCTQSFPCSGDLEQHQKSHVTHVDLDAGPQSPSACAECRKSFSKSQDLMQHQHMHHGHRFSQKLCLVTHQHIRNGKRPSSATRASTGGTPAPSPTTATPSRGSRSVVVAARTASRGSTSGCTGTG